MKGIEIKFFLQLLRIFFMLYLDVEFCFLKLTCNFNCCSNASL
jgi:hypothetical protein